MLRNRTRVVLWGARRGDRQYNDGTDRQLQRLAASAKDVGEATRQYQAVLEEHRRDPDDEHLLAEMQRQWSGLWAAWARHATGAA